MHQLIDTYQHKGQRSRLVNELQQKGIRDPRILSAFMDIPRHLFLESAFARWAYKDVAFPIDADQTISQPYTVAFQTSLLDVKPGQKILEIGTGSGFQACVLAHLGAKVYTIERQERLFHKTNKRLEALGYGRIRTLLGDGYLGSPRFAPFDHILITCGAPSVPDCFYDQVVEGGTIVVPLGEEGDQTMTRLRRVGSKRFTKEEFGTFSFVPFLPGVNTV